MKKAALLLFLVIVLFIPQDASAYFRDEKMFTLDPLEYDFITLGPLELRDKVKITLYCFEFYYVDFYLFDVHNFYAWENGDPNSKEMMLLDVAVLDMEFEVYEYGIYYFVVFNNDTETQSNGMLILEHYPYEPLNPLLIVGIGFSIICMIGMGAYLVHRRRKSKSLSTSE